MNRFTILDKVLICGSLLTIYYIYVNYPFISTGISFLIIFLSLSISTIVVVKAYNPTEKNDYESVEKKMDQIYQFDGIFKYNNDGFYINKYDTSVYIKWNEIDEISNFLLGVGKDTQAGLELIVNNKSIEINSNNSPGFEKFILMINTKLDIDPSWTVNYTNNPENIVRGGLYKKRIYKKSGIS